MTFRTGIECDGKKQPVHGRSGQVFAVCPDGQELDLPDVRDHANDQQAGEVCCKTPTRVRHDFEPSPAGWSGSGWAGSTYCFLTNKPAKSAQDCAGFRRLAPRRRRQTGGCRAVVTSRCCAWNAKVTNSMLSGADMTGDNSWSTRSRSLRLSQRHSLFPLVANPMASARQPVRSWGALLRPSLVKASSMAPSSVALSALSAARSRLAHLTATNVYRRSPTGTFRAVWSSAPGGLFACLGA